MLQPSFDVIIAIAVAMLISELLVAYGFFWDYIVRPRQYEKSRQKHREWEREELVALVNKRSDRIAAVMIASSVILLVSSLFMMFVAGMPHNIYELLSVHVPYTAMGIFSGMIIRIGMKTRKNRFYEASQAEQYTFFISFIILAAYAIVVVVGIIAYVVVTIRA